MDNSKIKHKGVGRIHRLMMRPMSLYESGDSNGKISLIDLFNDNEVKINGITSDLSLNDLIFLASRGGWPETLNIDDKEKQLIVASSYFDNICRDDNILIVLNVIQNCLKQFLGLIHVIFQHWFLIQR